MVPDSPQGLPPTTHQRFSSEKLPSIPDTVLVVEDEGNVRTLIMGMLQGAGFTVLGALDGTDALDLCVVHPTPIHLMITDFKMPGMSGGELIRRVAKLRPGMKFLCISGHPDEASVAPHITLLEKPFTLKTILAKVHELLDG